MTSFQASTSLSSSSYSSVSLHTRRITTRAIINIPKINTKYISLPKISTKDLVHEIDFIRKDYAKTSPTTHVKKRSDSPTKSPNLDPNVMEKLYAILEAVEDRVEMHKNIGEQRSNWNSLLLTSINSITLAAATMTGFTATTPSLHGLKLSAISLYIAATGLLIIMNKIQPSQLAEEQRNSARLFKKLGAHIKTTISIGNPTIRDVNEAMESVLALDKAYPLPLLGAMLEKFPSRTEPAMWWPKHQQKGQSKNNDMNGWDGKLEEEMREIIKVVKKNDKEDYLKLGDKALKLNKMLAIAGPLLTGIAAIGTAFVGSSSHSSLGPVIGVLAGSLATVVNTVEHGGQVGMVFEMYRSNAGFFKLMEDSIESNLMERDIGRRDNGEVLQMKVALSLGRSLSGLKDLVASSKTNGTHMQEFASKLF